ncbi:dna topoisomerase 2 [Hordeum vulgare]|nr:dna topoisomerase 2 [Hordeum vulgare]
MAQNFVGSNNIGLLVPDGPYGTRHRGGEDAALSFEAVYPLLTRLPPITRLIFPKDDDVLLNYLSQDGKSVEPSWYMPIIPMVLVNGSGIGTGSSCYVPNYNPRDIIANLKRLLNEETVVPMDPWYKGFKGSLKKSSSEAAGATYTITGVIEQVDDAKLKITELPIHCWTEDYRKFLQSMCPIPIKKKKKDNDKEMNKEPPFLEVVNYTNSPFSTVQIFSVSLTATDLQEYRSQRDHANVEIEVILSENNMNIAKKEGLEKKFNMATTIGTTSMHLFDLDGKIRHFFFLLEEFFKLRLEFYGRRKAVMLQNIEKELSNPKNKARFSMQNLKLNRRKQDVGGKITWKMRSCLKQRPRDGLRRLHPNLRRYRVTEEMKFLSYRGLGSICCSFTDKTNLLFEENLAGNHNEDLETKPAAQKKKPGKKKPAKKASALVRHDEDEVLNIKDRMTAYTIGDSPPKRTAESETTKEQKGKKRHNEPSKKGMTKKATAPLTKLSGKSEDNKFVMEEVQVEKKARGRKPAAEKLKRTAITEAPPPSGSSAQPVAPRRSARLKQSTSID